MAAYGQTLIEEFIDGGECTVLVAEDPDQLNRPRTFTPIRYRFPEGESFKHEQLKWVDYGGLTTEPINQGALSAMVREASARFFLGMRGAGYGRCDFRIDPDGRPFLLEINPNCGLYYPESDYGSADLCLAHDPMGHMGFTHLIVRAALQRHRRGRPTYRILPRPAGDYGLFANRGFHSGQVVVAREGSAHHLVSREWVEATADSFQRTRLLSHGWPITDHIWAVWSPDPVNWRPINHSCDPNCWLQGLDIVARRDIPEGEEITLEYATFCHEDMPAFECRCAAASCRKRIHGSDMLTEVLAPFGDHLSDYVRRKRQAPHA